MGHINFNISNEYEEDVVGEIEYYNGQHNYYYSEESMIRAFKNKFDKKFLQGIQSYKLSKKNGKTRHGLQYELIKEQYEELGLEYTELDYVLDYICRDNNNDNHELDVELVR